VALDPDADPIWCKLEFLNPSGSTKDRIARHMLEKAWRRGDLEPGGLVVEASSGSTSIALALACAQMGLRFRAIMPEGVSEERLLMLRAFGAEAELTPRDAGMAGALRRAEEIAAEGAFYTRQFENPDNTEAHRLGTGEEILSQIPGGTVDAIVSGVGTGGTIAGLHRACCESGCGTIPFVARPVKGTGLHVECCSFSSRVPGVLDGLSKLYDPAALEGLVELDVDDDLALATTRRLQARGFPVGPSSGLNYAAAVEASERLGPDAVVVTVFPDRMERYFSTELFRAGP
jgi:cysteine synthase A